MRTPPSIAYNGLTIVIDKPSRLDKDHLLSGVAGQWMEDEVIKPLCLAGCDIRDTKCWDEFIPGTKYLALLGPLAAKQYHGDVSKHGYPHYVKGIRTVVAYYPQDCCDHRNIEGAGDDDDDDGGSERDTKDASPTKRGNHRFWTAWHVQKLLHGVPVNEGRPNVHVYPSSGELVKVLSTIKNEDLYLDIETSRQHRAITCIGFSSTSLFPKVYVVPVYNYSGGLAYRDFSTIYRALAVALLKNTVVIHNSMFDLTVLHGFYRFPLPSRIYDTMLANHRAFPEVEKSLSHVIAQWTWQPYHKDQICEAFNSKTEQQLWQYNAKDVFNLKLIKDAQLNYAKDKPGLLDSIAQANSMVGPYLANTLTGLRLNRVQQLETSTHLTLAAQQYARICSILVGKTFNPGSPPQCKAFFHDVLHYPVVAKSDTGGAKLGRKQFYQLMLKHNNPLIPVILRYRKAAKDLSMLNCELWTQP